MRDLDPETIASDPVLRHLRERISQLETEIAECRAASLRRETQLREDALRRVWGLWGA